MFIYDLKIHIMMYKKIFILFLFMQNSYCVQNDLHNSIKIPIEHIFKCNEYDSPEINPIKKTKKYANQPYNWNLIKNFPDGARKVQRSFFFHICTSFFNMKLYEPVVGHAFLNKEIVCLIEQPTCKHLADLIQVCDINTPHFIDMKVVKEKIIHLLLISYELQQLTRPWDGVSSVYYTKGNNVFGESMFNTWAMIIPVGMELIETHGYKSGFVKLYKNAKYGYKRSFCMWLSLGIISFLINKKCTMLKTNYKRTIELFFLYNICSAVYFYKKLDNAYDNVKEAIDEFDLFAKQWNESIDYEYCLIYQHRRHEERSSFIIKSSDNNSSQSREDTPGKSDFECNLEYLVAIEDQTENRPFR